MDDLVRLLTDTQRPEEAPRKQAELDLRAAQTSPTYPGLLAAVAASTTIPSDIRQAALAVLRQFIVRNWTAEGLDDDDDDEAGEKVAIADDVKAALRHQLLELATRDEPDRRVKAAASYAINKIASVDYPEAWPDLITSLLDVLRTGTDHQVHGALRVLGELVDEGLGDMHFFQAARAIVEVLYAVAVTSDRKPILRALAVSVFRSSFDVMDMVKDDHLHEVKTFAQEALAGWLPFFHSILKMPLPDDANDANDNTQQSPAWNGLVALKLQCVKTLLKVKQVFGSLLLPEAPAFFQETWAELVLLTTAYAGLYVDRESQSRLEDADNLPYTLDFLVLEELDLLSQCVRASPVQKQLQAQMQADVGTPWLAQLVDLLIGYARITREEEGLWDIDASLYLAEETSLTANYTARTAAGDLMIKLREWLGDTVIEALYARTRDLFSAADADWRAREAALFLFTVLAADLDDCGKHLSPQSAAAFLDLAAAASAAAAEPLLQARGFLVAGLVAQSRPVPLTYMDNAIAAVTQAASEIVQVACIRALDSFLRAGAGVDGTDVGTDVDPKTRQEPVLRALDAWLGQRDLPEFEGAEDLLAALCETLRTAIGLRPEVVSQSPDVPSIDLLFLLARHGATDFQVTYLVSETFEDIVTGLGAAGFGALCARVVPTLHGFFALSDMTADAPLVTMATELVAVLAQNGTEPLPAGFVAQLAPKLKALLLASDEGEVLRPAAEALKHMLMHDHQQVFAWSDEQGNSGLVVCLQIIDRLLHPDVEDNAASEVGGLAAELVEKAGPQRLGDGMLQRLLQAVAVRLATAQAAPFIQSLILVFARLCLTAAGEVVDFLAQLAIGGDNGLAVVLNKWLDNSPNFTGYDEIRQNVIALSKLYDLNDARVAQIQVKGDLIVPASSRIVTRSRAKQNPDQYTAVPAPLKIVKLLIEELSSAQGKPALGAGAAGAAAAAADADDFADADAQDDEFDDEWEDAETDLSSFGLGPGATHKDLADFFDSSVSNRVRDDETQAYLSDFFLRAAREDTAGFKAYFGQLAEAEQRKLNELAQGA